MKRILKICIGLLIAVIVGLSIFMFQIINGNIFFGSESPFRGKLVNSQTINIENAQSLRIQYFSDKIEILESQTDELVLKEYMSVNKSSYYASIDSSGTNVSIQDGNRGFHWFFQSRIEIYLPASYQEKLDIISSSGSITIDMPLQLSELNLQNKSGSIKAEYAIAAPDFTVQNSSGSVKLETVESLTASIHNRSGSIKIEHLSGKVESKNTSGSTKINSGDFGGIFTSSSGSIKLSPDEVTSDLSIKNTSGSCKLYLKNQPSFDFTASSSSGSIDTYFENELQILKDHHAEGTVGSSPAFRLDVQTSSGSIKVYKQ